VVTVALPVKLIVPPRVRKAPQIKGSGSSERCLLIVESADGDGAGIYREVMAAGV